MCGLVCVSTRVAPAQDGQGAENGIYTGDAYLSTVGSTNLGHSSVPWVKLDSLIGVVLV